MHMHNNNIQKLSASFRQTTNCQGETFIYHEVYTSRFLVCQGNIFYLLLSFVITSVINLLIQFALV